MKTVIAKAIAIASSTSASGSASTRLHRKRLFASTAVTAAAVVALLAGSSPGAGVPVEVAVETARWPGPRE
uniref:Uncharacterized protein n=1 Tax=Anopheles albimanus TaxID=7167 RepID=A0A182F0U6_ANOAL